MATPVASSTSKPGATIVIASLMLFSMFFGAGNLIFPPMVGVSAGTNFWPAVLGFLAAGVLLPVLAIVAVAISGRSVRDLSSNGGVLFGLVFSVMAYLAIGAFYALPRTGAVSMETAITPLLGWEGTMANGIFNIVFFLIALFLAWRPNTIIDTLGKFLTPALVGLLIILIALASISNGRDPQVPTEDYASSPMVTGLFEGYNTMDAIAGLAFSIVIVGSLRSKGFKTKKSLVNGTITAALVAGALLAAIYLGLAWVGQTIPNGQSYESGAPLLADAANLTMGTIGQAVFSAIVILACMTTAVGLITSTSAFFEMLIPKVKYHVWACLFTALSILFAFQGLDTVLSIAVPFITFLYPPAISLIALTLIQPMVKKSVVFYWTYRLALWISVLWSALSVIATQGWGTEALDPLLSLAPGQSVDLGWIVPTAIAAVIGLVIDIATKAGEKHAAANPPAEESAEADALAEA
ncbi:branched-chain amino acid transport system II carrier protein [Corynebacterium tuberculostearicum]|uniref:Branched-chain amino acid transport system II carrier protein n=1 Tax=Corynebacterium tuberculostearicum TaxID=38304 RepID=A0AAE4NJI5_9CORY|nr:branched-chain amino acid transport system II carrier protein [Corynebacterium tuberculostearicum]MDV2418781.1 branched-chain amino acid transport system II carrier protein [Corynebacterium tuberculostearicum]MDV2432771.1 branched-chain amino acid transport system II carrier protein [Corynebacterium tuberculostearicum]WKE57461.1 branched-chain amino acid transport system II carrier protein [Corynebacterium tuberculostearicum]